MISGIYKIESALTGRAYIGSAVNVNYRWKRHLYDLKNNKHHSVFLQRHFDKYGKDDLIFSIIEECEIKDLILREQLYIDDNLCEFNICRTAGSSIGTKKSDEFKKKISEVTRGENNPTYGLIRTKEWRDKISKANKGKPSKLKGRKANLSEDQRQKMRDRATKRSFSKETRKKISDKAKIEISQYGKDGKFIRDWSSIKEASEVLKIDSGSIVHALKGRLKSAGKFIWKYKNLIY